MALPITFSPTLDADSLVAVLDHMRLKLEEEKQMQRILTEHEQQRLNKKKAAEKTLFRRFPESRAQSPAWKHEILTAIICWPCSSLILIQGWHGRGAAQGLA